MSPTALAGRTPVHPAGWPFIAAFAAAAGGLAFVAWPLAGIAGAFALWCAWFFRDPERTVPSGGSLLVAPADGRVVAVAPAAPPAELGLGSLPRLRLSVFMSVFDVHVNRMPAAGTVVRLAYRPGRFFNASFHKASEHNERQCIVLATDAGEEIVIVQIAGLVARRIVCRVREGQSIGRGERFGLIRFGSRVDVYLPPGMAACVEVGARTVAGETVIAEAAEIRAAGSQATS